MAIEGPLYFTVSLWFFIINFFGFFFNYLGQSIIELLNGIPLATVYEQKEEADLVQNN